MSDVEYNPRLGQDSESTLQGTDPRHITPPTYHLSSPCSDSEDHDGDMDVLFQNVVFYLNPFLGKEKAEKLESTLCSYGALKTQALLTAENGAWQSSTLKTTHIITDDLDFPDYEHATARGIHIVTPQWVVQSINRGEVQDPKYFSADPALIFSGMTFTTTGLPQYDRQLIEVAVTDLGGAYVARVTPEVTHMIALTAAGDKYDYIMAHAELNIKVVLPHWFQLCCNLRRLLPETMYMFPNPPMQDLKYIPDAAESGYGYAPQLYSNSVRSVVSFLQSPNQLESQFLDGFGIFMANDLNIVPELKVKMEEKVKEAGGRIVGEYVNEEVDIVICRFRTGEVYLNASNNGKTVASIDWLFHVLQTGDLPSPKASLLHYPIPPEPIAGMSPLVITVSNYTGAIREYLKRMIVATGATYKPTLSSRAAPNPTTHIICGNASGDKYEKGNEWNVKVVNHVWLEDCFQAWALQSETKPRYTLFPVNNQLSLVFGAKIPPDTLDAWMRPEEDDTMHAYMKTEDGTSRADTADDMQEMESPTDESEATQVRVSGSIKNEDQSTAADVAMDTSANHRSETEEESELSMRKIANKGPSPTRKQHSLDTSAKLSTPAISPSTSAAEASNKDPEPSLPSSPDRSSPAVGGVRVLGKRGAAVEASKALQKIVPDMNEFQEELRDEKRTSKSKRKKQTTVEELQEEDESMDVDADQYSAASSSKKVLPSSPAKRKRLSLVNTEERDSPAKSDDEDDSAAVAGGPKTIAKKTRKTMKASKDGAGTAAAGETVASTSQSEHDGVAGTQHSKAKQVRYISTGLKDQSTKQVKALRTLGIVPTTSVERCTHLVAKSIARTEKFLVALAQGKGIVHEDWLQACVDANAMLSENDYRIKDTENEGKFGMDLYKSLDRAREKPVFKNCLFYISPSTVPKLATLKTLAEAGGGKATALLLTGLGFLKEKIQKKKSSQDMDIDNKAGHGDDDEDNGMVEERNEIVAVVSCEEDRDMWQPILDAGAKVYSPELIITGILTQTLDLGNVHALA
ncbi:hypothetical protein BGX28_004574 [Mortierella sp. GBA30]|nr:hypothetical protein BGX28_004574 [Mortierella sp. GBA30]